MIDATVSNTAATDLASAMVAYEEHVLKIGPKTIPIRSWTLEDLVLEYMFNHCTRDEWVDRDRIVNWVIDTLNDESKKSKAIYDKCVAINNKIKAQLETSLELFDTSRDGYIKRKLTKENVVRVLSLAAFYIVIPTLYLTYLGKKL